MSGNLALSKPGRLGTCVLRTWGCSFWTWLLARWWRSHANTHCLLAVSELVISWPCRSPPLEPLRVAIFECNAVCCALMLSNLMRPCGSPYSCVQSWFSPRRARAWRWAPALDVSVPVLWPGLLLSEKSLQVWSGRVTQSCADIPEKFSCQKVYKCALRPGKLICWFQSTPNPEDSLAGTGVGQQALSGPWEVHRRMSLRAVPRRWVPGRADTLYFNISLNS